MTQLIFLSPNSQRFVCQSYEEAMNTVGVIGAGEIGVGVVQNLAQTGHDVVFVDVSEQRLDRSKAALKANIRFQSSLNARPKHRA